MATKPAQTLLRNLSTGKTQAFDPEHTQRILAYPNGGWGPVAEEEATTVTGDGSGTPLPPADDTEKTAPADNTEKTATAAASTAKSNKK